MAAVEGMSVGDPATDDEIGMGPVISAEQQERVLGFVERAIEAKATVVTGGGSVGDRGFFVAPTVVTDVAQDAEIVQNEVFGPVVTMQRFASDDEAVAMANDVRYGLAGYLWTNDAGRAHRFAHGLEAGMVWVNSENNRHLPTPFGGMKASGIGRDGGDYSFDFYMETKNVCVALGTHRVPALGK